ncbi:hypothetical protein [Pseudodesulfovibrio indicus]|uniref:hypothetical protein n=1 Tax=Pseudodesulfovibrio indicus TaxID=1716143 RepID=UPI00292E03C8|nr:hypothetical protein [Pseudodesulfovibrio indicus]
MVRFVIAQLLKNSRVLILAGMLFFFIDLIIGESPLSLVGFTFVASPLLVAVSNGKAITIRRYFTMMAAPESLRYFVLLLVVFAIVFAMVGLAAHMIRPVEYTRILAVLIFSGTYMGFSPLLLKMATGRSQKMGNTGKTVFVMSVVTLFVLINSLLRTWHSVNAFSMVLTALIGSFVLLSALCAVTAATAVPGPSPTIGRE